MLFLFGYVIVSSLNGYYFPLNKNELTFSEKTRDTNSHPTKLPTSLAGTSLKDPLCLAKTEETEEFPIDEIRDTELCMDLELFTVPSVPVPCLKDMCTWMSQEVSKWLVNGL